jgi:hypothetical protein
MQNWFASFALIAWPCLAIYLFATQRLSQAILWTVLGAQLALPAGASFKFEMIPTFDKSSIPNLCVLIGCLIVSKRPLRIVNKIGLTELLIVTFFVSPIITSQLNGDPIIVGEGVLPGVGLYDALSAAENSFIYVIPFFVGRQFLRTAEQNKEILYVLAMAGLIYSFPMLFEIRMSPNLQYWVFGFAPGGPGNFAMTVRGGGYRPMVFMGHGLIAAFFMMTTAVAATALWRARIRLHQIPLSAVTAYLSGVLMLCKSFGAALYGIVLIPIVRLASPRFQVRFAIVLVSIALVYPALRSSGLFPTQTVLVMVNSFSTDRAGSLKFRFDNEDNLLRRAFERPLFGWGRYGRNRVYNEDSGRDESITDGLWIITMGQYGLIGFLAQFGLLSLTVFRAARAFKLARSMNEAIFVAALSLILSINIVELLPNAGLFPWTWLLCGALLGRSESLQAQAVLQLRAQPVPKVLSSRASRA